MYNPTDRGEKQAAQTPFHLDLCVWLVCEDWEKQPAGWSNYRIALAKTCQSLRDLPSKDSEELALLEQSCHKAVNSES